MTKVPQPKWLGDFFFVYIILGLLSVNRFCILVIWKILYLHLSIITQMSMVLGLLIINHFHIFKVQTNNISIHF